MGPEAERPNAKLVESGYSVEMLGNVGGWDFDSLCYLCDLVYGSGKIRNNADSGSLKSARNIASCEFIVARDLSIYSNPEGFKVFPHPIDVIEKSPIAKTRWRNGRWVACPTPYIWRKIDAQARQKPIEWISRGEFLSLSDYARKNMLRGDI